MNPFIINVASQRAEAESSKTTYYNIHVSSSTTKSKYHPLHNICTFMVRVVIRFSGDYKFNRNVLCKRFSYDAVSVVKHVELRCCTSR